VAAVGLPVGLPVGLSVADVQAVGQAVDERLFARLPVDGPFSYLSTAPKRNKQPYQSHVILPWIREDSLIIQGLEYKDGAGDGRGR